MESIKAIKPGPKPKTPDGTPDERRRVTPPNQPKHPDLKLQLRKVSRPQLRKVSRL